jgi:hypothetical protein
MTISFSLRLLVIASMAPRSRALSTNAKKPISVMGDIVSSDESSPLGEQHAAAPPAFAWCSTASVTADGVIGTEAISGCGTDCVPIRPIRDQLFDLTKSTDWMEFLEHQEGRLHDQGGAGAYDTMRCDILLPPGKTQPRVWGEKHHLDRLVKSYKSLVHAKNEVKAGSGISASDKVDRIVFDKALEESRLAIHRLLSDAESSSVLCAQHPKPNHDTIINLIRLTLLWSPPQSDDSSKIVVRGHACSSCEPLKIHSSPDPIVCTVAAHGQKNGLAKVDKSLPARFSNPENKIASWCRIRKEMETNDTYKPPGVSEVLMVRARKDEHGEERLELLEGLSSNVFVLYKDGTLRTATNGVLNGFVRHLVLESAKESGLFFDPSPVFLHQSDEWEEAFITSSSRLIYPISKMLIPNDEDASPTTEESAFIEIWRDAYLTEKTKEAKTPKWQVLLNVILQKGGYEGLS